MPSQLVNAIDKSKLDRDELFHLVTVVIEQGALTRANSAEVMANLRAWRALAAAPNRWSWQWAAQAVASAEHLCLTLSYEAGSLVKLIQVGTLAGV